MVLLPHFWVASLPLVTALMKIPGEIPLTLGNTYISRDLRGGFPLILGNTYISPNLRGGFPLICIKSLDLRLKKAVNRKISVYFAFLDPY